MNINIIIIIFIYSNIQRYNTWMNMTFLLMALSFLLPLNPCTYLNFLTARNSHSSISGLFLTSPFISAATLSVQTCLNFPKSFLCNACITSVYTWIAISRSLRLPTCVLPRRLHSMANVDHLS